MKIKIIFCIFLLVPNVLLSKELGKIQPEYLRCEYRINPLGIDVVNPRLSWELTSKHRAQVQSAYRIIVSSTLEKLNNNSGDLWDSGIVFSDSTNQIVYKGVELSSRDECYWKVKVWDGDGFESNWSPNAHWTMGLLSALDWKGTEWITRKVEVNTKHKYDELYLPPARYLRNSFSVGKKIKNAKIYVSSKGIYELRLNGQKVGKDFFTPGWTDYNKRIYYNTYNVTNLLEAGENTIGAILADGWYAGYVGFGLLQKLEKVREFYGVETAFFCRLEIEYEDGSKKIIPTNRTWKTNEGAIREADILMGETFDARLEQKGWDKPGFNDSAWTHAELSTYPNGVIEAYPAEPVRIIEEIEPVGITEPKEGVFVFDMGKNFAGVVRLKIKGQKGTKVVLRYAEMLHSDGTLMTENLRTARSTDVYITKGEGEEVWTPKFTYHGFQYVEVAGLSYKPGKDMITGIVMSSDALRTSTFLCSNKMNNALYSNILTTQSANFFDIPTDCPQRDERLGWTGDIQIYARSATYNADVAAFLTKWLVDLDDSQLPDGAYPNYAPYPYARPHQRSTGWMDAGIIVPYTMYKVYNDTRIIRKLFPGMKKFMKYMIESSDGYLFPPGRSFGDWLSIGESVSNDFISNAYFGYDCKLMAEMATAIGNEEDAKFYFNLFEKIKYAFINKHIDKSGLIKNNDTETAYALALSFDLYPENLAQKGADRLASMIINNGKVFSTGFLGTKHVMLVLSKYGYSQLAYDLFMQTNYPSWGYSVMNGSTSIWERWNSYTIKDGFADAKMNSFSHYAFGSVAEWMFKYSLGINTKNSGFKNIILRPQITNKLEYVQGSYRSINGIIYSGWRNAGNKIIYNFSIPVNTKAEVILPSRQIDEVQEGGKKIQNAEGVKILQVTIEGILVEIGSGDYEFIVKN